MTLDLPCCVCGFTCRTHVELTSAGEDQLVHRWATLTHECDSCHPRSYRCTVWFPGDLVRRVSEGFDGSHDIGMVMNSGEGSISSVDRWYVHVLWSTNGGVLRKHGANELRSA